MMGFDNAHWHALGDDVDTLLLERAPLDPRWLLQDGHQDALPNLDSRSRLPSQLLPPTPPPDPALPPFHPTGTTMMLIFVSCPGSCPERRSSQGLGGSLWYGRR
eukprot:3678223-Rhodomonas_salina.1